MVITRVRLKRDKSIVKHQKLKHLKLVVLNEFYSFVHLEQSPIGSCWLPLAKTAAASKWPLRATRVRCCFGARGPQLPIGL